MKSNLIALNTRNQLYTCHVRFVGFLALQNVLRVANDGFCSLIHVTSYISIYINIYRYIYILLHQSSVLYAFQAKSNIINELH